MHIIRSLWGLFVVLALAACGAAPQAQTPAAATVAPQSATPTIAVVPTTVSAQATSVPQPTTVAPTTVSAQATSVPESTLVVPTPAATASATAVPATTTVEGERILRLQEPRLQGEDVRALQQRLLDLGYREVGTVDGIFGPQTEAAVRAFQQTNAMTVDGVVGPQTRGWLFSSDASAAVVPIVVHENTSFLLGGVQAGAWLDAPAAAPLLAGDDRYRVLTQGQASETIATGTRPEQTDPLCSDVYTVRLEPAVSDGSVAVGGSWPLMPRTPRALPNDDPALQQVVTTLLQGKGIVQPDVRIVRAVQVDLEGDGSDEIVVAATRLTAQDPTDAAAGDYSVVAVQATSNGSPMLIELAANYFPEAGDFVAPNEYQQRAVLDLNGDGVLEIVVHGVYYEGASTSAYGIDGNAVRTLLTTGCGA